MSLMNYGFTKSKLDEQVKEKSSEGKSKEKSPSKSSKSPSKSVKEGGGKESKEKKDKVSGSKPNIKKESNKVDTKSSVKKSTPKKVSSEVKKKPDSSTLPNMNSLSKMNGVHKLNSKSEGSSINTSGGSSSSNNSPKRNHDVSLPYHRIKMIMKSCPDVEIVPHEALHVITKATELFIQHIATESLKSSDSTMLDYEALSNKVHKEDNLEFLKETIPKKITWAECQKIIASKKANSASELL